MPDMFKEELEAKLNALVGDAKAAGYVVMTRRHEDADDEPVRELYVKEVTPSGGSLRVRWGPQGNRKSLEDMFPKLDP